MKAINPANERIKRLYFAFLKEAKRNGEQSVDAAAKALNRFEVYTHFRDFRAFHREQAVNFKKHLANRQNGRTREPLSKATLHSTLAALRAFFFWLAGQPGFRSKLTYSDADYFNLSAKELAVARAVRAQRVPTMEQIKHVLAAMPAGNDIEFRNRALVAFPLLTGARVGAIIGLRLKHIDLDACLVSQDAREVNTKYSKTVSTDFFAVGDDVREIVRDWVVRLRGKLLWGFDDPLFPATKLELGETGHFEVSGLSRKPWRTASPIRTIFKEAFESVGLPYFHPHTFRKTLGRFGEQICSTPEEFKAFSQNLSHESVLTTFTSYGEVAPHRKSEIMRNLARPRRSTEDLLAAVRELVWAGKQG